MNLLDLFRRKTPPVALAPAAVEWPPLDGPPLLSDAERGALAARIDACPQPASFGEENCAKFRERLLRGACPNGGRCGGLGGPTSDLQDPFECWSSYRCWRAYDHAVGNVRYDRG